MTGWLTGNTPCVPSRNACAISTAMYLPSRRRSVSFGPRTAKITPVKWWANASSGALEGVTLADPWTDGKKRAAATTEGANQRGNRLLKFMGRASSMESVNCDALRGAYVNPSVHHER